MAKRNFEFEVGEYYHIYNRGTDKRKVFMEKGDLYYFFDSIVLSNVSKTGLNRHGQRDVKKRKEIKKSILEQALLREKLVSVVAYCLLPNHYHFILKEEVEGGISKFMQKLGTSYTRYFNEKYERSGVLFQGKFKATHLTGEFSLPLTSVYVNSNYRHHKVDPQKNFVKTSLFEYLGTEKGEGICNKKEITEIIDEVGGIKEYKKYLKNQSDYFISRKEDLEG